MAGWGNQDHWSSEQFDKYGFRRADLKALADKLGVSLDTPLEKISASSKENKNDLFTEEEVSLLKDEISALKDKIKKLNQERPVFLSKYRDDDPLLLAIEIRNKEWVNYDPDNDRATRGSQEGIIRELENKGFTNRQASSIEMVACPIKR